jgi:hypothetical protein
LTGSAITCLNGVVLGCDTINGNPGSVDTGSGVTYTWGTNGHPVEMQSNLYGSGNTAYWEHWDPSNGQVLFENQASQSGVLAVGKLGISNASTGITVEDRDPFGMRAATHTGLQFTVWSGAPAPGTNRWGLYTFGGSGSNYPSSQPADSALASRILDASRPDAYMDTTYGLGFQGTRTTDLNSGLWTTPDWFGGYDGDVMSQQPYMWNNNNGLLYDDPSGFCSDTQVTVTYDDGTTECLNETFDNEPLPTIADVTASAGTDWFGLPPGVQVGYAPMLLWGSLGDVFPRDNTVDFRYFSKPGRAVLKCSSVGKEEERWAVFTGGYAFGHLQRVYDQGSPVTFGILSVRGNQPLTLTMPANDPDEGAIAMAAIYRRIWPISVWPPRQNVSYCGGVIP